MKSVLSGLKLSGVAIAEESHGAAIGLRELAALNESAHRLLPNSTITSNLGPSHVFSAFPKRE
jgi:hypothetical protein